MDELIQLLMDKADLTHDQAVKSVQTISEYIQSKLPPMMHGMIDNFLGASSADADFTEPK
jgi:hypothetical protein